MPRSPETRQRVLDVIGSTDEHLTADEILERVQAVAPDVHRATVYRSLDALTQLGDVEHTHLGHGPAVYHLVSNHHDHLVCANCEAVTDVDPSVFASLSRRLQKDFGFTMHAGHFAVVGVCKDCQGDR